MKTFKSICEFQDWRTTQKISSLGFVPTMGALHEGHLSLIKKSKQKCNVTIVSIFINQLQFSPQEDFSSYPRTINHDLKKLKDCNVDIVFMPNAQDMYQNDFTFQVYEPVLSKKLEGQSRPHFFNGVTTVVSKLFNIIQPTDSFFGMKDIQQLYIIKKMVRDLNYNIVIHGCPTIREKNGLAMSSRNQYLSPSEKDEAAILYQALKKGEEWLLQEKTMCAFIETLMIEYLNTNKNIRLDYLSIRDLRTFETVDTSAIISFSPTAKEPLVIAGAVYYKKVRLIDNVVML